MKYFYYYMFLFVIILIALYISEFKKNNIQEKFTPGIRRMYRPYVRTARKFSESFFQNSNNTVNQMLRKVGLY